MNPCTPTVQTINLGYQQMLVIDAGDGTGVRVLHGATWLTGEREADDVVLRTGQARRLRPGRSLIEGLEAARVELTVPCARSGWGRTWRRIVTGLRGARARAQFGAGNGASASRA